MWMVNKEREPSRPIRITLSAAFAIEEAPLVKVESCRTTYRLSDNGITSPKVGRAVEKNTLRQTEAICIHFSVDSATQITLN